MTPKALKALRGSIRKWEKIVLGTGVDKASENCPLCKVYIVRACRGCPVYNTTGLIGCIGTPYVDYVNAGKGPNNHPSDEAGLFHARRMLDFLRDLLPKKHAQEHFKIDDEA